MLTELDKNCHEYCPYRKYCRYAKGETGLNPEDCAMYYKIEDILNETDDIRREQAQESEDDDYD